MSGARLQVNKQGNERARGLVLTLRFLVVLDHSAGGSSRLVTRVNSPPRFDISFSEFFYPQKKRSKSGLCKR